MQRNIFAVLAQHTLRGTVNSKKEPCTHLKRLVTLLLDGNDSAVEYILKTSSDGLVHDKDENGWSLLHYAAEHGRAEAAEMLLEIGACASEKDNEHNTPLHIACRNKEAAVAHRLIVYGAEVTARNKYGVTPLNLLGKCRNTQGLLLKRILCDPGTVLAFPSRSYFQESLNAFWYARRDDDSEIKQNYCRLARLNFDDLYLLLCVVQSHGGSFQCTIANKWNSVDRELSTGSLNSGSYGSYHAIFKTFLQQYVGYYSNTITRLEKQRRKFVRSTCVVETPSDDVSMSKKTKIESQVATEDVLMSNEQRKPMQTCAKNRALEEKTLNIVPVNLCSVSSGYSSSLRVSDQTYVDYFDLSVNKGLRKSKSNRPSLQLKERQDLFEFESLPIGAGGRECTVEAFTRLNSRVSDNCVALPLTNGFRHNTVTVDNLVQPCSSLSAALVTAGCQNVETKALESTSAFVWNDDVVLSDSLPGKRDSDKDIVRSVDRLAKLNGSCFGRNGLDLNFTESKRETCSSGEVLSFDRDAIATENCSYGHRPNKEGKKWSNEHRGASRDKKRRAITGAHDSFLDKPTVSRQSCETKEVIVVESDEEFQEVCNGVDDDIQGNASIVDHVTISAHECSSEDRAEMQKRLQGMIPRRGAGECMLHVAARCGDLVAVQYLLCRSTSVNAKDNAGWTPLHEAVREGHIEVAEFLIRNGADVNVGSTDGTRPLHDAAASNDASAVRMLLARGAVATAENYSGETANDLTSCLQVQRILQEFSSCVTPAVRQVSGSEGSKLPSVLLSGRYSFGPVFELWDRPPPVLLSLSLCEEDSNRYRSYFLLSDVLQFLDMDETSFATHFPVVKPISVSRALFFSQVSELLVSRSGVISDFCGSTSDEIKVVQYSDQLREALDIHLQMLE